MRTLLMVVGAARLASAFPDSGKWVYTNITLPDQYIGNNTFDHLLIYEKGVNPIFFSLRFNV